MEAPMGHTNELLFLSMLSMDERRAGNRQHKQMGNQSICTLAAFCTATKGAVSQGIRSALAGYGARSFRLAGSTASCSKQLLHCSEHAHWSWLKKDLNCTVVGRRMAEASSPYLVTLDCALDSLLHSIASTDNSPCANSVQSKKEKNVFNTK